MWLYRKNINILLLMIKSVHFSGLRLMMFVNSSDYLPTTEATGVRIAIHGKEECPFPDTFGYSAPTGVISSFGISLRNINRLPQPYGNCLQKDNPQSRSIYKGYKYEPEVSCFSDSLDMLHYMIHLKGCFRSCYQYRIIAKCGCADPRYPKPWKRSAWCDSTNTTTCKFLRFLMSF